MNTTNMILVSDFCNYHEVEYSFIQSVEESGLIEITTIDDRQYIPQEDLKELESIICMYYDMDVNLEGVEIIKHLLKKMDTMHAEIVRLNNRLDFYEK